MWALAIADTVTGQVVLARDRFGIKPLYYHLTPQRLVFASEVQAIQRLLPGEVSPDPAFIASFLAYDVSAYGEDATCLREVRAIRPGFHARVLPDGRMESRQWYWLAAQQVPSRFEDQALALRDLLTDACRLRLRSDVLYCFPAGDHADGGERSVRPLQPSELHGSVSRDRAGRNRCGAPSGGSDGHESGRERHRVSFAK